MHRALGISLIIVSIILNTFGIFDIGKFSKSKHNFTINLWNNALEKENEIGQ
jgi:hypothetical protein